MNNAEHGEAGGRQIEPLMQPVPGLEGAMREFRERFPGLSEGALAKIFGLAPALRPDSDAPADTADRGKAK